MIITGKKFSKPAMSRIKNGDIILADNNPEEERKRLDLILVEKYPNYNRSTLQNFIKSGYAKLDGKVITKPNFNVLVSATRNGAKEDMMPEISLTIPTRQTPKNIKNLTIYEDDNVLVINKPAGLLSMAKGKYTEETTLEDYGLLVHRLDRDTSGVVILAKNEATRTMLQKQFQDRKTHKTYVAIISGTLKHTGALIDLPIARNLKHPTTFQVDPNGKPAQTEYHVLWTGDATGNQLSLLELKPITGRTHQLRVHLKYLGHPILGDRVYGGQPAQRLFLHAKSLEISIPGDSHNIRKTFTAPVPTDFFNTLGIKQKQIGGAGVL
ncbi:RluA family pseudouridine synthase [Candidatus Saccharibacteria bacterium]|nr:RluA family pseudouridine synthase [Candidatus Saccharibacteria bacterium]